MPHILADGQFELDGIVFGVGADIDVEAFTPSDSGIRSQDVDLGNDDGVRFGRDYLSSPTWAFDMGPGQTSEDAETALARLAELQAKWRDRGTRLNPGAVVPLRYCIAGRVRRVYGRPRRWSAPPDVRMWSGYIPVTADFRCADPLTYDDDAEYATIDLMPATVGGLEAPLDAPLSTVRSGGTREGQFTVRGTVPTWAVVRIFGPVTNPRVYLDRRELVGLDLTIPYDQSITVDSRPWARTVTRDSDGANFAGALTYRSRLSTMLLEPGGHELGYDGIDQTNTSRVQLEWRAASGSLLAPEPAEGHAAEEPVVSSDVFGDIF